MRTRLAAFMIVLNFVSLTILAQTFTRITSDSIVTKRIAGSSSALGDYDNDGRLDLFVVNGLAASVSNSLYHNNPDDTFTKMTSSSVGSLVSDVSAYLASAWGDYDNDG